MLLVADKKKKKRFVKTVFQITLALCLGNVIKLITANLLMIYHIYQKFLT